MDNTSLLPNIEIRIRKDINQTKEYVVKGTNGWNLVTNDPAIVRKEAMKKNRNYGEQTIHY